MDSTQHQRYRLVVLGRGHAGKTCLIRRYLQNTYSERYRETVEDIYSRDFHIRGSVLPLDIYDTNFHYPDMRRVSISSADAFMLVFAIDDVNSFKCATELVEEIAERRPIDFDNLPMVLVGCKGDAHDKKIYRETVHMWLNHLTITKRTIPYYETSAKTGDNVVDVFKALLNQSGFPRRTKRPTDLERRRRMLPQSRAATVLSSSPDATPPPQSRPPPRRQSSVTVRCLSASRNGRNSSDEEEEQLEFIDSDNIEPLKKSIGSMYEKRTSRFARSMSMKKEKLAAGLVTTPTLVGPHQQFNDIDDAPGERSKRRGLTRHGSLMRKTQIQRLSLKMKRPTIDEPVDESDCKIS